MFIITVVSLSAHGLVRFQPYRIVPSTELSSTYISFIRFCFLLVPTLNIVREPFEIYCNVVWGIVISDWRNKIFNILFWSLMTSKLTWHSWQHLVQRWCFPLFRVLISLESAMDWIRSSTADGRMMDPTLSYDLWETSKTQHMRYCHKSQENASTK